MVKTSHFELLVPLRCCFGFETQLLGRLLVHSQEQPVAPAVENCLRYISYKVEKWHKTPIHLTMSSNLLPFLLQLQDVIDQEYMNNMQHPPSRDKNSRGGDAPQGFVVTNAPWQQSAPDTSSTAEFPMFGGTTTPKSGHAWGPMSRR